MVQVNVTEYAHAALDNVTDADFREKGEDAGLLSTDNFTEVGAQTGAFVQPEGYGAVGNGSTNDTGAFEDVLADFPLGVTLQGQGGSNYLLGAGWDVPDLSHGLRIFGSGATISSGSSTDFIQPESRVDLQDLTLSGFSRPIYGDEGLGSVDFTATSLRVSGATLENISIRNAFDRAVLIDVRTTGGKARGIAFGYNDVAGQTNRKSPRVIGCSVIDLANSGSSQTVGFISYAVSGTLFAFCEADGIGAVAATGESDGFYTNSPQAIVLGCSSRNLKTTNLAKYHFNQKGNLRGGGGTEGYGGLWGLLIVKGDGTDTALQLQAGECTAFFGQYDNVKVAVEVGSTSADLVTIIGQKATLTGASGARGETVSVGANSSLFTSANSTYRNAEVGLRLAISSTFTLTGGLWHGHQMDGLISGGFGFQITGAGSSSYIAASHQYVGGAITKAYSWANVTRGIIDAPRINISGAAPFALTTCNAILIRDHVAYQQIAASTATSVLTVAMVAGDTAMVTMTVNGRSTDSNDAFSYRVIQAVHHDGASAAALGTATSTGSQTTGTATVAVDGSGDFMRCRVTPPAGHAWNVTSRIDITWN